MNNDWKKLNKVTLWGLNKILRADTKRLYERKRDEYNKQLARLKDNDITICTGKCALEKLKEVSEKPMTSAKDVKLVTSLQRSLRDILKKYNKAIEERPEIIESVKYAKVTYKKAFVKYQRLQTIIAKIDKDLDEYWVQAHPKGESQRYYEWHETRRNQVLFLELYYQIDSDIFDSKDGFHMTVFTNVESQCHHDNFGTYHNHWRI